MQARYISILFFLMLISINLQSKDLKKLYIDKHKSEAVKKMIDYGIPASIILAQAILESGSGQSKLAQKANNHFGIKCHSGWKGKTFTMDDDTKDECFRKYKNHNQSYDDYALFLSGRNRYAILFEIPISDYRSWAHGLKKAGYATNPKYAQLLINIIEKYNLSRFDKVKKVRKINKETSDFLSAKSSPKYPDYLTDETQDFNPVSISNTNRVIYETNGVKYVLALNSDNWEIIAEELDKYTKQLLTLNSANKKTVLVAGDRVFIERKKSRARVKYHIVQTNENLHSISQKYAVRIGKLRKRNKIKRKDKIIAGQRLKLR